MKSERTKQDREHIDAQVTKNKELKELMPDETWAIDRAEKKTTARKSKTTERSRKSHQAPKRVGRKSGSNRSRV